METLTRFAIAPDRTGITKRIGAEDVRWLRCRRAAGRDSADTKTPSVTWYVSCSTSGMHKQEALSGLSRICAWCGVLLNPVVRSRSGGTHGGDGCEAVTHTHTICDRCLSSFFAEECGPDDVGEALQPVAARRRA